jgi:hypothetical protein
MPCMDMYNMEYIYIYSLCKHGAREDRANGPIVEEARFYTTNAQL